MQAERVSVELARPPRAESMLFIPEPSLVLLIGAAGSGKSSFAKKHFKPTEVLSSDFCRGLVSDDQSNQAVTGDAFEVLRFIAAKRMKAGRLTVIDATNVKPDARECSLELARQLQIDSVGIVLNLPDHICRERNEARKERSVSPQIIDEQINYLRDSLGALAGEGFAQIYILNSLADVASAVIQRRPASTQPGSWEPPL